MWPRKIDWLPWEPFEYWHSDGERLLDPIAGWTHTNQPSHGSVSWLRWSFENPTCECLKDQWQEQAEKKNAGRLASPIETMVSPCAFARSRACSCIAVYLHDSVLQQLSWGWNHLWYFLKSLKSLTQAKLHALWQQVWDEVAYQRSQCLL